MNSQHLGPPVDMFTLFVVQNKVSEQVLRVLQDSTKSFRFCRQSFEQQVRAQDDGNQDRELSFSFVDQWFQLFRLPACTLGNHRLCTSLHTWESHHKL